MKTVFINCSIIFVILFMTGSSSGAIIVSKPCQSDADDATIKNDIINPPADGMCQVLGENLYELRHLIRFMYMIVQYAYILVHDKDRSIHRVHQIGNVIKRNGMRSLFLDHLLAEIDDEHQNYKMPKTDADFIRIGNAVLEVGWPFLIAAYKEHAEKEHKPTEIMHTFQITTASTSKFAGALRAPIDQKYEEKNSGATYNKIVIYKTCERYLNKRMPNPKLSVLYMVRDISKLDYKNEPGFPVEAVRRIMRKLSVHKNPDEASYTLLIRVEVIEIKVWSETEIFNEMNEGQYERELMLRLSVLDLYFYI